MEFRVFGGWVLGVKRSLGGGGLGKEGGRI